MKIKLLVDLPVDKKHGAKEGRIFDAEKSKRINGAVVFTGDNGEFVTALQREYSQTS